MDTNYTKIVYVLKGNYRAPHESVRSAVMTSPALDYLNASHASWWSGNGVIHISYIWQQK